MRRFLTALMACLAASLAALEPLRLAVEVGSESHPVEVPGTPDGWARNRRIELSLTEW